MLNAVLSLLDHERETVIELQRLLVATLAMGPDNGGDGERKKADVLKTFLHKKGLPEVTEYNAPDPRVSCGHRPNMTLIIPGVDTSRTFWIMAHMDVVPAGDASLWQTNPFELVVEGDELRGRGVEDNHHGLVTSVILAKALHESNSVPPINLGLLFVADEETGNAFGITYLLKHHAELFKPNDLFLVPDSGEPDSMQVETAEKGLLWVKVTVNGKQCHASRPHDGVNALRAAATFITKMGKLEQQFPASNPLFAPPQSTFEPTKKEANVQNINTIPGRDVFYIDCRVLPLYKLDDVMKAIRAIGDDVMKAHAVSIDYEIVQESHAAPITSEDSPIVVRLMQAIRDEYGVEPAPKGIGGGTVAADLRHAGLPTVVWSTVYENPHVPNERTNITFSLRDAKVMARVLFTDESRVIPHAAT
ncbi:MAG: M20 family metallo-hydrolase [Alphaproteobacteria bacterium]|nr:M20 family metallo-hydrolase [Alphaproteobacteria bacterium]